ncbi:acetylcholinesterase precursor [Truncatella angustata]|uniref:Carboxylic ester hydrolase n=1 Tax=Truncatella angustata TaxID=152316 RepID=A0A9P8RIF4_9PEZI|nr:acetylcholinesterase precursor [Truncatella angustata]KAH6643300.1 acetylcholinesterase precursor [Truncatella angustata]
MSGTASSTPGPTVKLPQGTVVGIQETGGYPVPIEAFKGIPYALPPTGDRRFRPPVKVKPSEDVIDASHFGPRAPAKQFLIVGPELEESEDCLTVNIFRQKGTTDQASPLPVALYMHGGAFNRGNAAMHDTGAMVGWSELPFIGVSFGYRIGALGFLPSKLSAKEGALNLGLKDQICLMDWVQDNISFFGGDPGRVTLFGLSAGAHSIGHHLLNYKEGHAPPFRQVIMESGAPTSRAVRAADSDIHENQFKDFLKAVECPPDLSDTDIFGFLRSLPLSTITKAQTTVFYNYNPSLCWAFQPVIDGEIIRRPPIEAWRNGQWHKMPILTGHTTNEGSLYVDKNMSTTEQFINFWANLLPGLTEEDLKTIDALYPDPTRFPSSIYQETRSGVGKTYKRIEAAYAQYAYIAPVQQTAHLASPEVPVYLYHWALESDVVMGARHGDNMFYEMRDSKKCALSQTQDELSGILHAYMTSFICTGDPNTLQGKYSRRPPWPKFEKDAPRSMVFAQDNKELVGGKTGSPAVIADDLWAKEESHFWWSKVEISQR